MTQASKNPFGWPRWLWFIAMAGALVFALAGISKNLTAFGLHTGLIAQSAPAQVTAETVPGQPAGTWTVTDVAPDGPAARAGLRTGDLLTALPQVTALTNDIVLPPDTKLPLTVLRDGKRVQLSYTTELQERGDPRANLLWSLISLSGLIVTAFGCLLILRGRKDRAAIMLGLVLLGVGLSRGSFNPGWAPDPATGTWLFLLTQLNNAVIGYCWIRFALYVAGGPYSRRQNLFVLVVALAYLGLNVEEWLAWAFGVPDLVVASGSQQVSLIFGILTHQLLGYGIIAWNYRRNDAPARNRLKVIVFAFIALLLAAQIQAFLIVGLGGDLARWLLGGVVAAFTAAAILLAYAVLRQRLFDLNFAINRTLVFGSVTFTLLATFGLLEWGVEHVIPEAWHEGGQFISAGIAVGLFLTFHRLREWFEHQIERLFFSSWQKAEAALRRFVESAGHFEQVPALCKGFHGALGKFAPGAGEAIYLRETGGAYRLECGSLDGAPEAYAEDQPAFALMRAERRPIDLVQTDSALPGELALPMLDQGALLGFVLVGPKPDGTHFRPDEVHNLGWAAHQVGLDLRALHARLLEEQNGRLIEKSTGLEEERERLTSLLNRLSPQT